MMCSDAPRGLRYVTGKRHINILRLGSLLSVQTFLHYASLYLYISARTTAQEIVCPTQSTSSFFHNFANATCDVVFITGGGFALSHLEAAELLTGDVENRVTVSRNVTLRGETNTTILDLSYLKRRILLSLNPIATNVPTVLTIESLVLVHPRQPSATSAGGLDLIPADEGTILSFRNAVIVYGMCAPLWVAVKFGNYVPRPPSVPGVQRFEGQNRTLCLPGLRAVTGQQAGGQLQVASDCFGAVFSMIDYAVTNSRLDSQGQRINMGAVAYSNTRYVCEHFPEALCMSNYTYLAKCVGDKLRDLNLLHWDSFDLRPAPAEGKGDGGPDTLHMLAIVLPCVLGGVALIAAAVGGAFWWRRRRRRYVGADLAVSAGRHPSGMAAAGAGVVDGFGATAGASSGGILLKTGEAPGAAAAGCKGTGSWGDGSAGPKWAATGAAATAAANHNHNNTINNHKGFNGAPPMMRSGTMSSSAQSASITGTTFTGLATVAGSPSGPGPAFAGGSIPNGGGASGGGPLGFPPGIPSGSGSLTPGGAYVLGQEPPLLANPLLQGLGSGQGSGQGPIALNLVLGVDVFASREAVVGRGSFATVLEGSFCGRRVAVKMFHRDALGSTEDDIKSLKQEISILARSRHPNVVALLGAGSTTAGDEVFLVEELMVSNLARVIHEGAGLSLYRVLSVARDIAAGLAYLHPTVIHRDLKPANVLLDQQGTAKLTDFGLSRLWASTVHTANPEAGTVQYMAPECFRGSLTDVAPPTSEPGKIPISHLSDIYSFGVLLWEMLAKERPWRGMTSIQVALAVGYEQQRLKIPEGTSDERFHPKLRKLITQCWETDPRKRPGAAEIAKRLSLMLQRIETHGSLGGGGGGAGGSDFPPAPCTGDSFSGSATQGSSSAAASAGASAPGVTASARPPSGSLEGAGGPGGPPGQAVAAAAVHVVAPAAAAPPAAATAVGAPGGPAPV